MYSIPQLWAEAWTHWGQIFCFSCHLAEIKVLSRGIHLGLGSFSLSAGLGQDLLLSSHRVDISFSCHRSDPKQERQPSGSCHMICSTGSSCHECLLSSRQDRVHFSGILFVTSQKKTLLKHSWDFVRPTEITSLS